MSKPHYERTLSVPPERLRAALDKLDPGSRALLELSVKRGIADHEIAQVLRTGAAEVAERRESILARIADDLGSNGPDLVLRVRRALRELPLEGAAAERNGHAAEEEPAEEVDGEVVEEEPASAEEVDAGPVIEGEVLEELPADEKPSAEVTEPEVEEPPAGADPIEKNPVTESSASRGGSFRRAAALAALVVIALVVLVVVLANGGDESSNGRAEPAQQQQQPPPATRAPLQPISDKGAATASIEGRRLTLTATGLGAASHEAWLYDSLSDSVSIGRLKGGRLTAGLPADPAKYRYLDVSVEPRDGNPNHSGESVLRVPISRLTRGG